MTIQQIRYALTIADTGSMNKAAKRLGIRQPTISAAISDLERELGITIFERHPTGMSVTKQGMEFLAEASILCDDFRMLEQRYGVPG